MSMILCGFKNCGKSTVGKLLAARTGIPFIDTDTLLEQLYRTRTGEEKETRAIYKLMGPRGFRNLESDAVQGISLNEEIVVATGGGAVMNRKNVAHLRQIGPIIYLQADAAELYRRMRRRPVLPAFIDSSRPKASFDQYYSERAPLYEEIADVLLNVQGLNAAQVIESLSVITDPSSGSTQQEAGA